MNNQKPPYRNPGPMITREEFIKNYLSSVGAVVRDGYQMPEVRVIQELIGSIYDLQQQITELQEKDDEQVR